MFYVAVDDGHAYLDMDNVKSLLKIECEEFLQRLSNTDFAIIGLNHAEK